MTDTPAPDDKPRWRVNKPDGTKYADIEWDGHKLWAEGHERLPRWLAYEAWDGLVEAVAALAEVERLQATKDAAAELIAAEDEMHLLDKQYEEAQETSYDFDSRSACLDAAIEARHRYADARKVLVALLADVAHPTPDTPT